jgi:hypothetical protein
MSPGTRSLEWWEGYNKGSSIPELSHHSSNIRQKREKQKKLVEYQRISVDNPSTPLEAD